MYVRSKKKDEKSQLFGKDLKESLLSADDFNSKKNAFKRPFQSAPLLTVD